MTQLPPEPFATVHLTEQQAVDLLNLVERTLNYHYPEEDSYNPTMRAIRAQLHRAENSNLLPGGLETN
jgi:hypothetical protein